MTTSITPVTPVPGISPLSAFDNRNVLVPLPASNPKVQEILQQDEGNNGSNPDLFKSELNNNVEVVVPLDTRNPDTDEKLKENGGNTMDKGGDAEINDNKPLDLNADNNFNSSIRERLINDLRKLDLASPLNDNLFADPELEPLTKRDTQMPLESVVLTQAPAAEIRLPNNIQHQFNMHNYIINALQGGMNEADTHKDNDHDVEFEA